MSGFENNRFFNTTEIYPPISDLKLERSIFVDPASTGTVIHQTMSTVGETISWVDVKTYAAGEGDVLTQGLNHFRFVPSDDTTFFKYM